MTCPHRWLIETPHGNPVLRGVCQDCGAERTWEAWPYEKTWGERGKARLRVMEKEGGGVR